MDLVKTAVFLLNLLCVAQAFSHHHTYMDNILPARSALRLLTEPLRFDPCCLVAPPPPPPLYPPPTLLWKRGDPVGAETLKVGAETLKVGAETLKVGAGLLEPSVVVEDKEVVPTDCSPGPPGPAGSPGTQGRDGFPGISGPKGDKGEIGRPGSKGRSGGPGLPGKVGQLGGPGTDGPKGEKGDPGLMGLPGTRGLPGTKGLPGYKGEKGAGGDSGVIGLKGDKGSIGLPGMLGQKGEFGPKGESGVPGKRGPTGRPGKRGKQGQKGHGGSPGVMGPSGPPGPNGTPGPPGPPASGLYVVGEKGEQGLPGPAGVCECDPPHGPTIAPFGSYTQRGNYNKVPAIFVVNNEEELEEILTENAIAFRKDQRILYFKGNEGWKPIQPFQRFQSTEKVPDRVGVCGDGKVQAQNGEECDDGNKIVTDACLNCKWSYCGDGYRHQGMEECDGKDFGYQTCKSYLPGSFGQLRCTDSCLIDSTGCKYFT